MVTFEDQVHEFTLLNPGSVFDIYNRRLPIARKGVGPLDLPTDDRQCAHVNWDTETQFHVRCQNDVRVDAPGHGYLCMEHNIALVLKSKGKARNQNAEHVESIIQTDFRAIEAAAVAGQFELVKFTKTSFLYLDLPLDHPTRREIRAIVLPAEEASIVVDEGESE